MITNNQNSFRKGLLGAMLLSLVFLFSCSSSKSESEDSSEEDEASGGVTTSGVVIKTKLTGIYPSELVLSSPYTHVDGTDDVTPSVKFYDYKTEVVRTWDKINSDRIAQCIRDFSTVTEPTEPTCFGPAIEFQGHPDGSPSTGEFADGNISIWSSIQQNKEACSAAKLNYEIDKIRLTVDLGLDALKMLVCAGQLANLEQPTADGDTVDMTEALTTILTGQEIGGTLTSADISRADNSDGEAEFTSNIIITRTDESVISANLRHIPVETDNSLYKGKFWVEVTPASGAIEASSILYSKSSDTEFSLEFRNASFPEGSASTTMFDGNQSLKTQADSSGYSWGIFSFDPITTVGQYAYSWVDGASTENLHSYVGNIAVGTDANESCAHYGAGATLDTVFASATRAAWLDRMICNVGGPGVTATGIASLQKQCMQQDGGSGRFEVTSNNTAYIPRNSCGPSGEDSSGFSWRMKDATTSFNSFSSTNDLAPISGLETGALTIPTMIDDL